MLGSHFPREGGQQQTLALGFPCLLWEEVQKQNEMFALGKKFHWQPRPQSCAAPLRDRADAPVGPQY